MQTDDLGAVLTGAYAEMSAAQAMHTPSSENRARGRDREGWVEVVVDGHGLLADIVYSDGVEEITPAELESAVLEALQDAYGATGRPRLRSLPDLGNSDVSAQVRRILGMEED